MLAEHRDFLFIIPHEDRSIYERLLPQQSPLLDAFELIDWKAINTVVCSYYSKDHGQPAIPPLIMLKLEYLRYHFRLSSRQVVARAQTDLLLRWFLQVPIRFMMPDASSLTKFRGRLGAEGFKAVFDQLIAYARQAGLVQDRLRLKDATHILANVAVPTTLTLLSQLRRKMLDVIGQIDPEVAAGFDIQAEQVRLDTEQAEPELKLQERVALVVDILLWLQEQAAPPQEASLNEQRLWQKLLSVRQLAEKIVNDFQNPGQGDRTLSVVDPDARQGKHGEFYDGYMLDIMVDADSQLITQLEVLPANGQEAMDAVHLVQMEHQAHGNQIKQISIDGAGFHGPMLRELEDPAGLAVDVIASPSKSNTLDRTSSAEFELNEDGTRVTCPAGVTSNAGWTKKENPNATFFDFPKRACASCPLRPECHPDMKPNARQGRRVSKNEYELEYERAREKSKTGTYQEVRREHPAVERKLNEIVRHQGGRRAQFWGMAKVMSQQTMTCFTVNVKRIAKLLKGEVRISGIAMA